MYKVEARSRSRKINRIHLWLWPSGGFHQKPETRDQCISHTITITTPSPLPHYHHPPTTNKKDVCHNFLPSNLIVNEDNDKKIVHRRMPILELCEIWSKCRIYKIWLKKTCDLQPFDTVDTWKSDTGQHSKLALLHFCKYEFQHLWINGFYLNALTAVKM